MNMQIEWTASGPGVEDLTVNGTYRGYVVGVNDPDDTTFGYIFDGGHVWVVDCPTRHEAKEALRDKVLAHFYS